MLSDYTSLLAGGYFHIVWVGDAAGFAKVLSFVRVHFANFVTLYQGTLSIFCYYNFVHLDQFSMITRPYPRVNDLKTIPFTAAHTRITNIWEYPPPGVASTTLLDLYTKDLNL